jgi:hypothetical protein
MVEVEVKNPLQVPLQFTHVHLVGTYTDTANAKPPTSCPPFFLSHSPSLSYSSINNGVVTVEVEVKNPLQVPLQFTHVHLVGTYTYTANAKPPTNIFQFSHPFLSLIIHT